MVSPWGMGVTHANAALLDGGKGVDAAPAPDAGKKMKNPIRERDQIRHFFLRIIKTLL